MNKLQDLDEISGTYISCLFMLPTYVLCVEKNLFLGIRAMADGSDEERQAKGLIEQSSDGLQRE